jgi:hypothetical protein
MALASFVRNKKEPRGLRNSQRRVRETSVGRSHGAVLRAVSANIDQLIPSVVRARAAAATSDCNLLHANGILRPNNR